ncbi:SNF2 family N-terminal domain-containing protein [Tricladium varicosporioides]|nr:SNF2 family N-terminal domain-containing protein [Hymenoscyphus varicosporioides]
MAPAKGRGRPRKAVSLGHSLADSRSSSTQRSTRRSLNALSTSITSNKASVSSTLNRDDVPPSNRPSPSMIGEYMDAKNKADVKGRGSLSSVSTSNDYNDSSGYSTPATSAVATPINEEKTTTSRRRPRTKMSASSSGPSLVARAAALRNSKHSLNPNKRKRVPDSEDDEDDEEDNSPDAQLARALQEQEDHAANNMTAMDVDPVAPRRTPRNIQKILPKSDFVTDLSDDELDIPVAIPAFSPKLTKRPKIELSSQGSNSVKFTSTKAKNKTVVVETDESDFVDSDDGSDEFAEIQDSDAEEHPFTMSTSRSRTKMTVQPKSLSVKKSLPPKVKVPPRRPQKSTPEVPSSKSGPPTLKRENTKTSTASSALTSLGSAAQTESEFESELEFFDGTSDSDPFSDEDATAATAATATSPAPLGNRRRITSRSAARRRINLLENRSDRRGRLERQRLESHHPELHTMWTDLENLPKIGSVRIEQPTNITRELKPFQLEGVAWMKAMEKTDWGGGLLGDEMGMGKTIQAVSLIMSDFPAPQPSLVLIPPVALMQWQQEIEAYTDGTLKTFVYHGTNAQTKGATLKDLMKYNVILMSYNSLESMYRKQEKGFKRKNGLHKEPSIIHQIRFHRVILDEAHNIKQRTTGCAKACFALKADHKWCLSGTPLQNRIGEFFSLVRFLDIRPFACYFCKQCPCSTLNWEMNEDSRCVGCKHSGMQHVSVFNQELLNPIQKFGNKGPGKEAFRKLRILTDRFMLRRVKRDHSSAMELPAKEIYVDRQFFGEEENDFAGSIMNNGTRKFETYVAQGVLLNNYANIFGLIMQMRQVADHPDLILKKNGEGGQNILVCCICDETAEEAIRSTCRHDFCRECAKNYLRSSDSPDCPQCHIPLSIDLEAPEIEQDEQMVKKSSIINRIKMENWTSSSKIEALVHDLWQLRSKNRSHKSIIFSQFTTMLQLVEWRLRRAGITTVMLDGSMTPAQRQASINHFMTDVNVECFLVSLKAGGVALNLTEASHVFIVDPWWNPAAEWQSADRCHRIGQARPCSITRLCIEDSVESRMVLLQEKKANMINSTINADESAMESLTPEDMQFLFRGT